MQLSFLAAQKTKIVEAVLRRGVEVTSHQEKKSEIKKFHILPYIPSDSESYDTYFTFQVKITKFIKLCLFLGQFQ